jgi:alpha-1,2-mannosyltransferase
MPAISGTKTKRSVVVALACLGGLLAITVTQRVYGVSALAIDHAAVRDWLCGGDLYAYRSAGRLGTDASPVTAILLVPLAFLPLAVAGRLIAIAGVAALLLAVVALVGPVARRYGRPRALAVLVATALALLAGPVRATLGLGDLDLILFGLLTADIVALRRGAWARSRAAWWPGRPASQSPRGRPPIDLLRRGWATGTWAGVGTGIATALAVSPIIFVGYLAVTRQWRAALTALSTAAGLTLGALVIAPSTTATWFGTVLPQIDRDGPVDAVVNQSLAGLLARLYHSAGPPVLVWLSFAVLLLAVGLIRARAAHADGDEIAAFTLVGLTGSAIGPVSEIHELVWVLPAVLILVDAAARRRVTARRPRPRRFTGVGHATAAGLVAVLFLVDPVWTAGWYAYALTLIVLLNTLPWRPGVAPAVPTRRPPGGKRPSPAIPGPRPGPRTSPADRPE